MYSIRSEYPKTDPMNMVAKLLMNSLYGKFGMKPDITVVDIFNTLDTIDLKKFEELLDQHGELISDHITLDNHEIIIRKNIK